MGNFNQATAVAARGVEWRKEGERERACVRVSAWWKNRAMGEGWMDGWRKGEWFARIRKSDGRRERERERESRERLRKSVCIRIARKERGKEGRKEGG